MDNLIIYSLAVWYVAYAVTSTHGIGGSFDWMRKNLPHGGLLDCPVCLALWVAILFSLLPFGILISALAIAGGAMILHGIANWRFGNE